MIVPLLFYQQEAIMYRVLRNLILFAVIGVGLVFSAQDDELEAEREFATIQKALDKGELGFSNAIKAYSKLIRTYPETQVSAKAQCQTGNLFEKMGEMGKASDAYMVILDKYPDSQWFPLALENLYRIGCHLFILKTENLFVNTYEHSRNIFKKLLEIGPYSENAGEIQYKTGICSMELGDHTGAILEFKKVVEDYPVEPWLERASYQLGVCYLKQSLPAQRDQAMTDKAIRQFTRFREKYPGSKFIEDVGRKVSILENRKAESLYLICLFYQKQNEKRAFLLYYNKLNRLYPDTEWAEMARALLKTQDLQ